MLRGPDRTRPAATAEAGTGAGSEVRTNRSTSSPARAVAPVITAPIGTALPSPNAPTSGAAAPPMRNCAEPSRAAAVPADSPCRVRARAGVFGMMQPTEATTNHSGTSSIGRPPPPVSAPASRALEAANASAMAPRSTCRGPNRRTRTGLTWVARTRPKELRPKTTA